MNSEPSLRLVMANLLEIVPGDAPWRDAVRARVDHVRDSWPAILVGQFLALGVSTIAIALFAPAAAFVATVVPAALALILVSVQAVLLRVRAMRTLPEYLQVSLLSLVSVALGLVLSLLFASLLASAAGAARDVGLVGIAFATALAAMALSPLRAAFAGFLAAVAGVFVVGLGSPAAVAMAVVMASAAILTIAGIARSDIRARNRRIAAEMDRGLAMRLVREFEGHGSGWFWETDREGRFSYLSERVRHVLESGGRPVIGRHFTDVLRLDSPDLESERTLGFHLSTRTSFADYSVQAAEGAEDRWWSISGRPLIDEIGQFRGFVGSGGDLTEKRRADAEISRLALFDGLTGLANRQRMRLSLDKALNAPGMRRSTALFMLDLDRFKAVNDTLGHQVGDALLKIVGQRLQRAVGDVGLVGRLGGDEFQVILADPEDREWLAELAAKAIAAISAAYVVGGATISIGCSIGIAVAPDDGVDSETLIRNADLALYAAKAAGRGIHCFYRAQLLAAAQGRRQLEDDLREALSRGEFHLAYQPVVSTADSRIVGYEALLRWDHPIRGSISPADFIPIAEESGLIEKIGEWVLRTACAAAAKWPEDVRVAVNVSPIQFANEALPAIVTSALAQSGITSSRLELEITEGVFLSENSATDRMFAALKAVGVRLALDDFGTGYASLGYLKQAPFDKIKIDQSFVHGAAIEGSRNAAIIKAIVALADTLGMETTAEGVEVQDEIELIRELGCSHIQGYVYGKPTSDEGVRLQLANRGEELQASGHRTSRAPRIAMLRTATIEMSSLRSVVRIRNITAKGAMIEGVTRAAPGMRLTIEIFAGENAPATVQWVRDTKAGLLFDTPIELDRFIAVADNMLRRVA